jgi:hypothetical protein
VHIILFDMELDASAVVNRGSILSAARSQTPARIASRQPVRHSQRTDCIIPIATLIPLEMDAAPRFLSFSRREKALECELDVMVKREKLKKTQC